MNDTDNKILIKSKDGQLKTVNLGQEKEEGGVKDIKEAKGELIIKKSLKDFKESEQEENKKNEDLTPRPISVEESAPAFYIDLKDEQEVEKFKDRDKIKKAKQNQKDFENLVELMIKKIDLDLNGDLEKRLKQGIKSYLKGIRNLINFKELLIRPVDLGGVGLNEKQTEEVIAVIKNKAITSNRINERNKDKNVKDLPVENKGVIQESNKHIGKAQGLKDDEIKEENQFKINKKQNISVSTQDVKRVGKPLLVNKKKEEDLINHNYKPKRKIYGPVEELAHYDLDDLRHLAPTLEEAIKKIKHKILLLQDESYEKRAQGIQAWRNSPVYQEYFKLGQESLVKGKSVKELISIKKQNQQDTLNFKEFEIISDFNQELNV